jgi:adenylosuccinate lyase
MQMNFESYLSPFSWRYGSEEMRQVWSEIHKRRIWRQLWIALAEVQAQYGLVSTEQVDDLRVQGANIDIQRSLEIEAEIHHDLMAEIKTFSEQSPLGAAIIHLGATSMDIKDNADAILIREALQMVIRKLSGILLDLCDKIEQYADYPIMAFTHLQPAEPSTLGYRFSQYTQEMLIDWEQLDTILKDFKGKGFKGAVGTSASYAELIGQDKLTEFEDELSRRLNLPFYRVTTQIYSRKQEYYLACAIAGLGASLYKFAFDLRLLQSPAFGELAEPFSTNQVGSSAMPFKRNPINAEKVDSLARLLAQYPRLAWDNAAHTLLEITLDESANRRTMLPEMFLIVDELLVTIQTIIRGLEIKKLGIQQNLDKYAPFAATERVLMEACKAGANRQEMHERLRLHAMRAWSAIETGGENPLIGLISTDENILKFISRDQINELMDIREHLGLAFKRSIEMANQTRITLERYS